MPNPMHAPESAQRTQCPIPSPPEPVEYGRLRAVSSLSARNEPRHPASGELSMDHTNAGVAKLHAPVLEPVVPSDSSLGHPGELLPRHRNLAALFPRLRHRLLRTPPKPNPTSTRPKPNPTGGACTPAPRPAPGDPPVPFRTQTQRARVFPVALPRSGLYITGLCRHCQGRSRERSRAPSIVARLRCVRSFRSERCTAGPVRRCRFDRPCSSASREPSRRSVRVDFVRRGRERGRR